MSDPSVSRSGGPAGLGDRSQIERIEAAREAKEAWSARLAALEDGTLQWIEGTARSTFVANDLAEAFQISPQAANNRLLRLVRAGIVERYRLAGPGKQHRYHRKIEFWEKVPIDLMWHYLQVIRLRALFGANEAARAQQVCRVIADEVGRIAMGEDPAGYLKRLVRETRERLEPTKPPGWTDERYQAVKDAFE